MELFVMNRFDPTAKDEGEVDTEREARLLAKLNSRKSKRARSDVETEPRGEERQLEPQTNETLENVEEAEQVAEQPRKKKKRKKTETPEEQISADSEKVNEEENKEPGDVPEDQGIQNLHEAEEEPGTGFTILEQVESKKAVKISRVLPSWLAKPSVISCDLGSNIMPVKKLPGLHKFVLNALGRNKIKNFFPVQQQVIPFLLQTRNALCRPCDICVSAPTGSGKTLAFVLPTIQILSRETVQRLRCLVVLPVHDLAVQVYRVYANYCTGTKLHVALISGQTSFFEEQKLLVRESRTGSYLSRVDIAVCTPGRLVDHLQRTPGFSLSYLKFLIIDEADRIMDEAPNDWMYHFEKAVGKTAEPLTASQLSRPPLRNHIQKLLFSATLSQDPEKLTRLGLFQPRLFTSVVSSSAAADVLDAEKSHFVGKYTTPAELTEHSLVTSSSLKPLMVHHLVRKYEYRRVLCFAGSLAATHRLYLLLRHLGGSRVAECSSQIGRGARDQLLKQFSAGKIDLMVCTDAVARGMDLGTVDCVISYDPPKYVKNYIHRIGRTARAGRPGTAITLLTKSEVRRFEKILDHAEKKTVRPLEVGTEELEQYEETFKAALASLKKDVQEETLSKTVQSSHKRRRKLNFKASSKAKRSGLLKKSRKTVKKS